MRGRDRNRPLDRRPHRRRARVVLPGEDAVRRERHRRRRRRQASAAAWLRLVRLRAVLTGVGFGVAALDLDFAFARGLGRRRLDFRARRAFDGLRSSSACASSSWPPEPPRFRRMRDAPSSVLRQSSCCPNDARNGGTYRLTGTADTPPAIPGAVQLRGGREIQPIGVILSGSWNFSLHSSPSSECTRAVLPALLLA